LGNNKTNLKYKGEIIMKNNTINKPVFIVIGIIVAFIIMIIALFVSANNKAINMEEQINSATASIEVQEKRRVDLTYNLVDTVQEYAKHESNTLEKVTEARTQASTGDIENAQLALNAVAEQYPELKANENYKQLMTELSLTENTIAEYRNNYNIQVRSYNKFVRSFPNSMILNILGYEKIDVEYTDYNAPSDAPQNLFEDE
jgi:LemA protein